MAKSAHSTMTRRQALTGTAAGGAAIVAGTGPAIADGHPDAELLALGRELDAAWAIETEAFRLSDSLSDAEADGYVDPFVNACSEIVDRIENAHASTLDGLRVKARAVSWAQSAQSDDIYFGDTTDVSLAAQIIATLLDMGAEVQS